MKITRGKIDRAQRVVIYAPEGIGKSTLAGQLPDPLFFDVENGTAHLDVARVEPEGGKWSFSACMNQLSALVKNSHGFKSVVIDSIDWLEEAAAEELCKEHKKDGIEGFGYGKGYIYLNEKIALLLARLDQLMHAGLNVILIGHSEVKRVELPELPAFDRYQLRLSKQVMPLVREWADAVLFGNFKMAVKEPEQGKAKAVGGKERVLYCEHSATADAKNRHGLKAQEPWSVETLLRILGPGKPVAGAVASTPEAPSSAGEAPGKFVASGATIASAGVASAGTQCSVIGDLPTSADPIPDIEREEPEDPDLERALAAHEAVVNTDLIGQGKIKPGQTFRSLSVTDPGYRARILGNPVAFIQVVQKRSGKGAAA